jgi:hypothetical protein
LTILAFLLDKPLSDPQLTRCRKVGTEKLQLKGDASSSLASRTTKEPGF